MEITSRDNLAVTAIRAERFGPEPLLREAVARGRATLDGPLLPGRPSGWIGNAGCSHLRCGGALDAVTREPDTFESAPRDAEPAPVLPFRRPSGCDSVAESVIEVVEVNVVAPLGGLLDVMA